MRIGIIGTGKIGGTLAKRFIDAGNEVAVSNSRGPDTLAALAGELGSKAQALTATEAERFGELVVKKGSPGRVLFLGVSVIRVCDHYKTWLTTSISIFRPSPSSGDCWQSRSSIAIPATRTDPNRRADANFACEDERLDQARSRP